MDINDILTLLLGSSGMMGVYMLKNLPAKIWGFIKRRISYSITVNESSSLSTVISKFHAEIQALNKSAINNHLEAEHRAGVKYISLGNYFVYDKGHFISISRYRQEHTQYETIYTTVSAYGFGAKKFIQSLSDAIKLPEEVTRNNIFLCLNDNHGHFIPKRSFDSIFTEHKDEIVETLNRFINSEDLYKRIGINYKLGILLHGKPGTGKSSIARAIASYIGYDLQYIDLTAFPNKASLAKVLSDISNRTVVLLEDIDCLIGNRDDLDPDTKKDDLLNLVLNFLDGALSPNECIIVATTNYVERLDDAFVRAGRFDAKFEINELSNELITEMCSYYGIRRDEVSQTISPSELQYEILKHLYSNNAKNKIVTKINMQPLKEDRDPEID